jgi:transposase
LRPTGHIELALGQLGDAQKAASGRRGRLPNLIERMFCCLKHWRRIATRYDKLATNFAAAVAPAAVIIWRI